VVYFGPTPHLTDPLNSALLYPFEILPSAGNGFPYGSDIGGCRTRGDILYVGNFWQNLWQTNPTAPYNRSDWPKNPAYYDPCPYDTADASYPNNLVFRDNTIIQSFSEVPQWLLKDVGYKP
jgi:hypothetical protein